VLNADDPAAAAIADRPRVRRNRPVVRYFSLTGDNPVIERHRRSGGITYQVSDGQLVEFEGASQRPLLSLTELPGGFGGLAAHVVANALAAVAACRGIGISAKDIRRALATFTPGESNPGRGNVYLAAGTPVVVDYGHNAAALDAMGRMISSVWGGTPTAAVTLPGDRRDDLIIRTAEAIAAWFGRVIVYEDADKRGRVPGEMTDVITTAMRRVRPDISCAAAEGPQEALRAAVAMAAGQPVLFLYEKLAMAREALDAIGARPAEAAVTPPSEPGSSVSGEPAHSSVAGQAPASAAAAAELPASAGAYFPARVGATAHAEAPVAVPVATAGSALAAAAAQLARPLAAGAEQLVPPLAAAAEQLVPPLTAAAEQLAPSATRPARLTSAGGPLRRADRLTQWNRGHW